MTAFGKCKQHDFALSKRNRCIWSEHIEDWVDSGYQGIQKLLINAQIPPEKSKHHPLSAVQKAENRALAKARICVEHVIRRIEIFRILSERYRNHRQRFALRFNLIASITNLNLLSRF